ncbi:MAG: hypothetical protein QN168_06220 [Armatimonadota bacterium]|nr:hypothetical protein [Armatimonadota bacterium]
MRVAVLLAIVILAVPEGRTAAGPSPSLFPLVVGAVWVRRSDDGGEATSRVVGPKTVGTTRCTVVERRAVERGRERIGRTCFLATASEVLIVEWTTPRGELQVLNPPRPTLKLPPRAGQTWSWSPASSAVALKITERWIGEETIKVVAGTFRAWKLQTVATGEDSEITTYTWYAPGVGAVRSERKGRRGDRQISGWSELVSYRIP